MAYLLSASDAGSDLWLVPSAGGAARRLTENVAVRSVIGWNARGHALALVAPDGEQNALWTIRPDSAPRLGCRVPRNARSAAWLADGTRLTFAARASGNDAPPGEFVHLCDLRSGEVIRVTPKGYFGLEFAWSPRGDRLAVSRQERPGFYEGLESDLLLVDASTGAEVLIDAGTGSSGEAVAIAFRGRPNTRSFGARTAGFATVNRGARLPDGANMVVTVGYYTDRGGTPYLDELIPDVTVDLPTGWPSPTDRVSAAAVDWLRSQPAGGPVPTPRP